MEIRLFFGGVPVLGSVLCFYPYIVFLSDYGITTTQPLTYPARALEEAQKARQRRPTKGKKRKKAEKNVVHGEKS